MSNSTLFVSWKKEKECFICAQPFTFRTRRHHCRFCGNSVCDTCSPNKSKHVSFTKLQRIWKECKENLAHKRERTISECRVRNSESLIETMDSKIDVPIVEEPPRPGTPDFSQRDEMEEPEQVVYETPPKEAVMIEESSSDSEDDYEKQVNELNQSLTEKYGALEEKMNQSNDNLKRSFHDLDEANKNSNEVDGERIKMKQKLDDQMAVITRLVSQNRKLSSKNREAEETKKPELQCKCALF